MLLLLSQVLLAWNSFFSLSFSFASAGALVAPCFSSLPVLSSRRAKLPLLFSPLLCLSPLYWSTHFSGPSLLFTSPLLSSPLLSSPASRAACIFLLLLLLLLRPSTSEMPRANAGARLHREGWIHSRKKERKRERERDTLKETLKETHQRAKRLRRKRGRERERERERELLFTACRNLFSFNC